MKTAIYRLADKNIEINSLYDDVHLMCTDYLHEGPVDFSVRISQQDIDSERQESIRVRRNEGLPPFDFSDSYLETLAVYRKICKKFFQMDRLLFHGSAIAVDGECYLFTAKSGTGKSTHTRLWRKMLGDKAIMINDDKPIIRIPKDGSGERAIIYGTPWDGKHRLSTNISVPLKSICWLQRGEVNYIEPATDYETCQQLMKQSFIPHEEKTFEQYVDLLNRLTQAVKLYHLTCNMDDEAALVSYNGMK